ncbi:hypothetical protein L195_g041244 [Trifolium pratense]|uniref:Uncharacterized protein n=1 Tax=Trifolium pratense TaxID=57577 RepID=A0A2K3LJC8_TRIPR|nr:hypothetical protein L195_g034632 [Trifolium pratense]PNX84803.1 hypothetical protein L195_g040866 [Trifolium pratense]PNX85177.1 hypothetical protein L195_g041244 [Trifolium pratense]
MMEIGTGNSWYIWLPENIVKKIAAIAPPQLDAGSDCLNMESNEARRVSVKGMYIKLCNFATSHEEDMRKLI